MKNTILLLMPLIQLHVNTAEMVECPFLIKDCDPGMAQFYENGSLPIKVQTQLTVCDSDYLTHSYQIPGTYIAT